MHYLRHCTHLNHHLCTKQLRRFVRCQGLYRRRKLTLCCCAQALWWACFLRILMLFRRYAQALGVHNSVGYVTCSLPRSVYSISCCNACAHHNCLQEHVIVLARSTQVSCFGRIYNGKTVFIFSTTDVMVASVCVTTARAGRYTRHCERDR